MLFRSDRCMGEVWKVNFQHYVKYEFRVYQTDRIQNLQTRSDVQIASIQWILGALSSGIKRQGRDVDHSPPSSADVKNGWSYTSTTPICLER